MQNSSYLEKIIEHNLFDINKDIHENYLESLDREINEETAIYLECESDVMKILYEQILQESVNDYLTLWDNDSIDNESIMLEDAEGTGTDNTNKESGSIIDKIISFLKSLFHLLTLGMFKEKKIEESINNLATTEVSTVEAKAAEEVVKTKEFSDVKEYLKKVQSLQKEASDSIKKLVKKKAIEETDVNIVVEKVKELTNLWNNGDELKKYINEIKNIKEQKSSEIAKSENKTVQEIKAEADTNNQTYSLNVVNQLKVGNDTPVQEIKAESKELDKALNGLVVNDSMANDIIVSVNQVKKLEKSIQLGKIETIKAVIDVNEVKSSKRRKKKKKKK